jgi:predicted acyltransferase
MKDYKQKTTKTLITWVLISIILGVITYPLTKLMPLNKKIYSISYTTLSATTSGFTLTLFVILIDIIPENRPKFKTVVDFVTQPLLWMGRNPLIVFFMRDTLDNIMGTYIIVNGKSLTDLFYENAFSSWISNK